MKNKYVVIGMIIIIAVTVILAVYEIVNSIAVNKYGVAIPTKHKNIIEIIKTTDNYIYKKEQIEINLEYDKITDTEINKLY